VFSAHAWSRISWCAGCRRTRRRVYLYVVTDLTRYHRRSPGALSDRDVQRGRECALRRYVILVLRQSLGRRQSALRLDESELSA
jgi:hypothetical protein